MTVLTVLLPSTASSQSTAGTRRVGTSTSNSSDFSDSFGSARSRRISRSHRQRPRRKRPHRETHEPRACTEGLDPVREQQRVRGLPERVDQLGHGRDVLHVQCQPLRKKSGDTWTCEPCKTGQKKAATKIPSTEGEDVSDCTAATSCEANQYLVVDADSGNYCEACPAGSTSDGSSTTCTCEANKYAKNNECVDCDENTFRTGSVVPGKSENKNVCEAAAAVCTAGTQYVSDNEAAWPARASRPARAQTREFCTCSDNHYAKKWQHVDVRACKTGQTKAATKIPSTEGEDASACTAATSCASEPLPDLGC